MVLDDKTKPPHTIGQKPEAAPTLVLLGASIREHVHAGGPVSFPSGGNCIISGPIQVVVGDLS